MQFDLDLAKKVKHFLNDDNLENRSFEPENISKEGRNSQRALVSIKEFVVPTPIEQSGSANNPAYHERVTDECAAGIA